MENLVVSYFLRHQNTANLILHAIGIPLVVIGVFMLFIKRWKAALVSILAGYLLQYLGHLLFERNQMGEWALIMDLIKKISG